MISDDLNSCFLQTSEHKRSVESGTSNPKSEETFSVFADGWCGEPLEPQHLTIDFTPNKETDTEFIQRKVCSFWEFIENSPELHKLRVKADGNIVLDTGSSSDSRKSVSKMKQSVDTMDHEFYEDEEESIPEKTAVEMLEFAENKNLINRIFGAKMASTCSLGPREYIQEDTKVPQPKKKEKKKKLACTCISSPKVSCPLHSSQIHVVNKKPSKVHGSKLKLLSRQLNDWDAKHPKNMDPPGHAPALQHCTIQRQVHHNLTCL
ncbi:unnamed protein product [Spodoptera littoralis]|uniref:Uncharacterized protein n=1 Tax=Spodoptera littoralis TaxID=7109 RepID=A0A9P0IDW9_SPOLI|nr:unnamed protein product [Spodoptera littoralis]CAH1645776.1 unnamed protein product [Spodoptera littoralis]